MTKGTGAIVASCINQAIALKITAEEETGAAVETKAKCPFGYGASNLAEVTEEVEYLSDLFKKSKKVTMSKNISSNYDNVFADVVALFDELSTDVSAQDNPRGSFVGCLVRVAGHDFMDYRIGENGGSDGCVNLQEPDNKGIQSCLTRFGIIGLYNQKYRK